MALRTGSADLPLHGGRVPAWLATRMASLGRVIVAAIAYHYGRDEVLRRLAHPFWFQSFGAVMGMDWHSSGITTSVLGALKRGLQPVQHELGIYVCGGRGKQSRKTPDELLVVGEKTGLDAAPLVRASRLVAKIDHAVVQDGFDLYLHGFIVTSTGKWCVVQQGMSDARGEARRYHWLSENFEDATAPALSGSARLGTVGAQRAYDERLLSSPHAAIEGRNRGVILNLADARANASRRAGMQLVHAGPDKTIAVLRGLRESKTRTLSLFPELDRDIAPTPAVPDLYRRNARKAAGSEPDRNIAPTPAVPEFYRRMARKAAGSELDRGIAPTPAVPELYRRTARKAAGSELDNGIPPPPAVPELDVSVSPKLAVSERGLSLSPTPELPHLRMPARHDVRASDIDLKRLHATLAAAADRGPEDFAELLLIPGVGARTVEALAMVAEVVHGTPSRFKDPARFSMAHGGKDGHPFPVPLRVYDETIRVLKSAVDRAKLGNDEKLAAIRRLDAQARSLERLVNGPSFEEYIRTERERSPSYDGRIA
ncbi:MAG TPA: DUF763 domain-containing protein [Steroidobacteraceae bacterium]|nr:DUF763 domain-containing protein [Steroidobacteraceae bacterium]